MAKQKVDACLFGKAAVARREEQQAIEETIKSEEESKGDRSKMKNQQ